MDITEISTNACWVPPNDRELIIRAKLKTGWASRTPTKVLSNNSNQINNTNLSNASSLISDLECIEIEQVLMRAARIEQKEMNRINNLYNRWNTINNPLGNGKLNCLVCNTNFGILESSPKICSDCLKNVCGTCSIETTLPENPRSTICLCKICSEYRDFLKKSGAWFNKRLPSTDPFLKQNCLSNCSPLKQVTSSGRKMFIKEESELLDDEANEDQIGHSISGSFKRLTDDSDDEELGKNQNDSVLDLSKSESSKDVDTRTIQSNSSTNISNCLKEDFERENYSSPLKSNQNDMPLRNLKHANSSSSLSLPHNQIQNDKSQNNKGTRASSTADLNDLKMQIANSRNISKTNNKNLDSTGQRRTMVNLATVTEQKKKENNELGSIQFQVEYIPLLLQLKIFLTSATSLVARDSNGYSDPYIKLHLLPGIAKATKLRSKTVFKNLNPKFNESLHYDGITLAELGNKTLRLTVLDEDKFGSDFIGEFRLPLNTLILNEINRFDVPLEPKQELGDEHDATLRGKINFSMKYSKSANCLFVKINRCRQLLPMDNGKSSDPFVEVSISPGSFAKDFKSKFKTTVKKKTLDPEFLEEFKFQNIDLKSLLTKTIEITVWDKDFGKNDYIGSVTLNQNRTGEELRHFFTMVKNTDIYHEQWHTLQDKEAEV